MRSFVLAAVLAFPLLAGCLSGDDGGGGSDAAFTRDCSIGTDAVWWPEDCLALSSWNPSTSKAEVDLAVNPTDPLNIVVASKDKDPEGSDDCVWSVSQVTHDGGKTWQTVYVGGDREHRVPEATGYECVTDPMMVFDDEGTLYYAMQIYDHTPRGNVDPCPDPVGGIVDCTVPDTGSAFILARSTDGGLTYEHYFLQAEGAGDLLFHDYPRMFVNPQSGSIHTIWNAYIGTGAAATIRPVVSTSRDGGETVDPAVYVMPDDPNSALAFFSGFGATRDGTIYVTMEKSEDSDAGDDTQVWMWTSTDDGQSFQELGPMFTIQPTPRQHGDHRFRTPSFVEMAIDDSDGPHADRIYTFWTDDRFDTSDILMSYSDDGAATWSDPAQVAAETAGGQYFMRPRVDADGRVWVLYTTQAYSGSEWLDQELAWSDDGGQTWGHLRLTDHSYDGDLGIHQDDFPFIGDYNGLGIDSTGAAHAAFGYTGTGRAEIAYAHVVPSS